MPPLPAPARLAPVHVVEDDAPVREALAAVLEGAGLRCRTYASALEFLGVVQPGWAGCVVADLRMPGMGGLELQKELLLRGIRLPVVIVTGHADVATAVAAMKAGAVDLLEKPVAPQALLASIRLALATPAHEVGRPGGASLGTRLANLSAREREVMLLLVAGHPNKVVADRLGISPRTVEVHRARIMDKTGAATLADLVRMACHFDGGGGGRNTGGTSD